MLLAVSVAVVGPHTHIATILPAVTSLHLVEPAAVPLKDVAVLFAQGFILTSIAPVTFNAVALPVTVTSPMLSVPSEVATLETYLLVEVDDSQPHLLAAGKTELD